MEISNIQVGKLYDLTFRRPEGEKTVRVIVDGMRDGHWISYIGQRGAVELKGSCVPEFFADNAVPAA